MEKQEIGRLVERFKAGDRDAFQTLYDATRQQAYFVAVKITKNEEDALDILQDSYIKAWNKLDSLTDPESFVSWFNQIVANTAKNYVCKKKPMLFDSDEDEAAAMNDQEETDGDFLPEGSLDQEEACRIVQEILEELPEDKKLCVILRHYEEMSIGQIAEALDISEGTVKSRLHYAHAKIKERVEEWNKKGVTLFSGAALPFFFYLLVRYAETVQMSGEASAQLLKRIAVGSLAVAGTTAAGTASTTAAAATASTAAASAGATATASTAAAGVAMTKIIALVTAGVLAASGAAYGVKKTVDHRRQTQPTEPTVVAALVEDAEGTEPAESTTGSTKKTGAAEEPGSAQAASEPARTEPTSSVPKPATAVKLGKKSSATVIRTEPPAPTTAAEPEPTTEPEPSTEPETYTMPPLDEPPQAVIHTYQDTDYELMSENTVEYYGPFKQKSLTVYQNKHDGTLLNYEFEEAPHDAETHFSQEAAVLIRRTNELRREHGLNELEIAPAYFWDWAKMRAVEINTSMSHTRPDGSSCDTTCGPYETWAENIAVGYVSGEDFYQCFYSSSSHYANLLSKDATHISVGFYLGPDRRVYCCMSFIGPAV